MLLVNEFQKTVQWILLKDEKDPQWQEVHAAVRLKHSVEKLESPDSMYSYACTLQWQLRIMHKPGREVLFRFRFEDRYRLVSRKGYYDPEKTREMLRTSNAHFLAVFRQRRDMRILAAIAVEPMDLPNIKRIEKELRNNILSLEYPDADTISQFKKVKTRVQ